MILSQANRMPFARAAAKAGSLEVKAAAFDFCFSYAGAFDIPGGFVGLGLRTLAGPNKVRFILISTFMSTPAFCM